MPHGSRRKLFKRLLGIGAAAAATPLLKVQVVKSAEIIMVNKETIPYVTAAQMREVDRAAMEDYHIDLLQMMETAGHHLARLARVQFLQNSPHNKVVILAGRGGNGGDALVSGRYLHNWGHALSVFLSRPETDFNGVPLQQLRILKEMGIPILAMTELDKQKDSALIIDGLIGYGLKGQPRGTTARLIEWTNKQTTPVLAFDVPSGLESTEGKASPTTIKADATLTLALPKTGLKIAQAKDYIGELYLADIGIPPSLYARAPINLNVGNLYLDHDVLKLT